AVTVIAHDEITSRRHYQLAAAHKSRQFITKRAGGVGVLAALGKVIAVHDSVTEGMNHIGLFELGSVHEDRFILQMNAISGQADHTLDEIGGRLKRIEENNNVPAMDGAVRKHVVPGSVVISKVEFVSQEEVADQERVLHGLGRHAEGLHHKRDNEHHDHGNGELRLCAKGAAVLLPCRGIVG